MIQITKYAALSEQVKSELKSYIKDKFGHILIVNETEWAIPNWTVIYYDNAQITTFYNIVIREISVDDKKIKVGGINNVITPKAFRGMGFATKALSEAENLIFKDLNCEMGLLLCASTLIPFYQKFNWYKIDCPVYFKQSDGEKLWGATTMLLNKDEQICANKIELNGLPW